MLTFSINQEDRIIVIEKTGAKQEGSFSSRKELEELTKRWPMARLVSVWNEMAGATPVRKFASRQIATARIWEAVQKLTPLPNTQRVPRKKASAAKSTFTAERGSGSKKDDVIALLSAGAGATLVQFMAATGWQKHSVRGFLSTLNTKMGLKIRLPIVPPAHACTAFPVNENPLQITLIVGPTRQVIDLSRAARKAGPCEVLEFPASASTELANPKEQSD